MDYFADRSRHFLTFLSFVVPFQMNTMGLQTTRIRSLTSSKRFGAPVFRAFYYYRRAHPKVVRLLRKHKPHDDVDANDFFAASTQHQRRSYNGVSGYEQVSTKAYYNDSCVSWWLSVVSGSGSGPSTLCSSPNAPRTHPFLFFRNSTVSSLLSIQSWWT
jgi:hypothetical protein